MPQQTSNDETAALLPPATLSQSPPCIRQHAYCSHPTAAITSLVSPAPQKNISLVITIVTTEQVPGVPNTGTTTTIDRELKLRLTLPPCYDANQLKSLNVKLHQDNSSTTAPMVPSSCQPTSRCSSDETAEVPRQWRQQQRRLFRDEKNHQAVPSQVLSSEDNVIQRTISFDQTSPRPETVSSSSTNQETHNSRRKRMRTTNPKATATVQPSSRKKIKPAGKLPQ